MKFSIKKIIIVTFSILFSYFSVYALRIDTSMLNTIQVIKSIFVTSDGSDDYSKAIVSINHNNSSLRIYSGSLNTDIICNQYGNNCKNVDSIITSGNKIIGGNIVSYIDTGVVYIEKKLGVGVYPDKGIDLDLNGNFRITKEKYNGLVHDILGSGNFIMGNYFNRLSGDNNILHGSSNSIIGDSNAIIIGDMNKITSRSNDVRGYGGENIVIGGQSNNLINSIKSHIYGGFMNIITGGKDNFILNASNNNIIDNNYYSTIIGGFGNIIYSGNGNLNTNGTMILNSRNTNVYDNNNFISNSKFIHIYGIDNDILGGYLINIYGNNNHNLGGKEITITGANNLVLGAYKYDFNADNSVGLGGGGIINHNNTYLWTDGEKIDNCIDDVSQQYSSSCTDDTINMGDYCFTESNFDLWLEDSQSCINNNRFATQKPGTYIINTFNGMGINTASPNEVLSVSGAISIKNTDSNCDLDHRGTIKYSGDIFFGCNSNGRQQLNN